METFPAGVKPGQTATEVVLFVCLHPSLQFFSHVRTFPGLSHLGLKKHKAVVKVLSYSRQQHGASCETQTSDPLT